jgi:hypothetical protein
MNTLVGLFKKTVTPMGSVLFGYLVNLNQQKWKFSSFLMACMQMVRKWRFMVFNVIFNNISVISWRSVLLVEEIGGPVENHRPFGT